MQTNEKINFSEVYNAAKYFNSKSLMREIELMEKTYNKESFNINNIKFSNNNIKNLKKISDIGNNKFNNLVSDLLDGWSVIEYNEDKIKIKKDKKSKTYDVKLIKNAGLLSDVFWGAAGGLTGGAGSRIGKAAYMIAINNLYTSLTENIDKYSKETGSLFEGIVKFLKDNWVALLSAFAGLAIYAYGAAKKARGPQAGPPAPGANAMPNIPGVESVGRTIVDNIKNITKSE